jgi:hypothetical protein
MVLSSVAVVSELSSGQLARWVKVAVTVGSPCVAVLGGGTAEPFPLARFRDVGSNNALILPGL